MFPGAPRANRSLPARLAFFFGLWLVIAGWSAKDLPVGLIAAGGAAWISLSLLPPGGGPSRIFPLVALFARLLGGSVVAGFDVARRALSPRLDLRPGLVACPVALPDGVARNAFFLLQSLQPGTLPTGSEDGTAFVHGLDLSQKIAENFATEEHLFQKAVGHE